MDGEAELDDADAGLGDNDTTVDDTDGVAEGGGGGCNGWDNGGTGSVGRGGGCTRIGRTLVWGGPNAATVPASLLSVLLLLPLFLGRFVPGGASRLTVQYDPNPGSEGGRG